MRSTPTSSDTRLYLRVPKTDAPPYGLQEVTGASIFTKPTLLCCGGSPAKHDRPDIANNFAKQALGLVHCLETNGHNGFQTATVTYGHQADTSFRQKVRAFNDGDRDPRLYGDFVETQLRPLFLDAQGKKRPLGEVKKNFRNINVITFSYGSFFISQVGNLLVKAMGEAGFTPDEIQDATRQILVLAVGPYADRDQCAAAFTKFNLFHRHDQTLRCDTAHIRPLKDAMAQKHTAGQSLVALMPQAGTPGAQELSISTTNPGRPAATILRFDPAGRDDGPKDQKDKSLHGYETYFHYSFGQYGVMLRSIASAILANGLNHSIESHKGDSTALPPHASLLRWPQQLGFEAKDGQAFLRFGDAIGYNARIDAMLEAPVTSLPAPARAKAL